jgi:hypothetical protein
MSNQQPKTVHTPSNYSGQKPSTPTFVRTPWSTDPQTSRGIFGVN